ncbi:MAG: nucleotidyl transferase AbiEii/AbiGii toxin family protein [Acidobacteria bacterium]|nr:nucleotidyl transferase AbiEii/AbiGii toxin family protein [Acidobacteriota bacterium]
MLAALRQTARLLDARHQSWALVGGLAVSIRAEPRFTRDIDLAVAVADDEAAESLVADFVAATYTLKLSLEQRALGRLAAVRLLPPGQPEEGVVIDLLFTSSGIEPEICRDAERLEIAPGLTVPVAQAGHLVAMKVLALAPDRPQDGVDLRALVAQLTQEDRRRAIDAVARIEARGANRGKALGAELERWLEGT